MKISGVLLAAGCSSRMGSTNKLLLGYKNHTILEEVLIKLLESKLEKLYIITGFEHEQVEKLIEPYMTTKIKILFNSNYRKGRATSIHRAVSHIQDKSEALLFMVADKPMIQSSLIDKAIDMFISQQPDILYVKTPSGRGHPIIFSQKLFSELLELEGDTIGDNLIEKHSDNTIILEDNTIQQDINTIEDYLSMINGKI
jgi:molybdenum cofactor cytidylyltransferase